jgi:hypothetical protein
MKIKEPKNVNYCATIAKVTNIIELDNCDNVAGAIVCGSHVIVSKTTQVGDIGVFFPIETKLSEEFLGNNNLYRKGKGCNVDKEASGYFEENGRLRAVKFRGHKSEGLFMPIECISFTMEKGFANIKEGDEFDELNGIPICQKYVVKHTQSSNWLSKKDKKIKKISRLVENQFHLHIDTAQLKKNIHRINPDDLVSITGKLHGTSAVFSNILVKRKLSIIEKCAKLLGAKIEETEYDYIYSSRNVVKNGFMKHKKDSGFYSTNIWEEWNEKIKELIPEGFSIYGEIVGYQGTGQWIQKGYDYGQEEGTSELYVYRITQTSMSGNVTELTRPEIDEFCKRVGLKTTPLFYYGFAENIFPRLQMEENWHEKLLEYLDKTEDFHMNNIKCPLNNNEVPAEGCVIRIERMYGPTPFKLKNYAFYERETKLLDKGEEDIEEMN